MKRRTEATATLSEDRIAAAFGSLAPAKLARFLALEMVVLGAGVCVPFRRKSDEPTEAGFGYSESSTLRNARVAAPLLLILEDVIVQQWMGTTNPGLRLLHLCFVIYGTIWIWGAHALMHARPHRIAADDLCLHRGIWGHLRVSLADIVSAHPIADPASPEGARRRAGAAVLTVTGTEQAEITLRTPVTAMGFLGRLPPSERIIVSTDNGYTFCRAVDQAARLRRKVG